MNTLTFDSPSLGIVRTNAPSLFPFLGALFAQTLKAVPTFLKVGILWAIRMSLWTMGFQGVLISTKKVLTSCYGFHMVGIDTNRIRAKMVNVKSVRNLAFCQFIGQAMCKNLPFLPVSKHAQDAITMLGYVSSPQKTCSMCRTSLWSQSQLSLFCKSLSKRLGTNPLFPILQMRCHFDTSRLIAWNTV